MIVTQSGDTLAFITQHDHAHFAYQLFGLWLPLREHPRRPAILRAIQQHDNGWWEADAAPTVDGEGRPHDFMTLPPAPRAEIWRRGSARYAEREPALAWRIVEHALRILDGGRVTDALLDELRHRRDDLSVRVEATADEVAEDDVWLEWADLLSLIVCNRWTEPLFELPMRPLCGTPGLEARWDGDRLHLDPFPLAAATHFEIRLRRLEKRRFGPGELARELARCRFETWRVGVVP